jgi:UDP-glucose 4-epimerase
MRRVRLSHYRDAPNQLIRPFKARHRMDATGCSGIGPLSYCVLRYFNVAGADPAGRSGRSTREAFHLIHVAVQAALDRRQGVDVFGAQQQTDPAFVTMCTLPISRRRMSMR